MIYPIVSFPVTLSDHSARFEGRRVTTDASSTYCVHSLRATCLRQLYVLVVHLLNMLIRSNS